jgi:L-alanine-DL-glutamate epimerase-like enolase superfamily enzyme
MLEGKEVEGKIGEVGQYSVDVMPDANVNADASVAYEQMFGKFLKVKAVGGLQVELDTIGGLKELVKGNEFLVKAIDSIALMVGKK